MARITGSALAIALALATPGLVLAQGAPAAPADTAQADALFEEGRALAASGDNDGACAKFDASQKIRPGIGTLFNLAECHEKQGRLGLAYAEYVEVAERTKVALQADREKVARERIAALESKIGRVAFETPTLPGDLVIQLDGVEIPQESWSKPVVVDPGEHVVKYGKRGTELSEQKVTAVAGARPVVVDISRQSVPVADDGAGFKRNTGLIVTGSVLVGVGLISLGISGYVAENNKDREGLALVTGLGGLASIGVGIPLFVIGLKKRAVVEAPPGAQPSASPAPAAAARIDDAIPAGVYLRPEVAGAALPIHWNHVEPGALPAISVGAGAATAGWRF